MFSIKSQIEGLQETLAPWMYVDPSLPVEELSIKPEVRFKLLKIAQRVRDLLPIKELPWIDIIVVGSSLGYNYTEDSDVDLHFLIDVDKFAKDHNFVGDEGRELLQYMFRYLNIKELFNIDGHSVEFYWQGKDEDNETPAIYSIVEDKILKYPTKPENVDSDLEKAKRDAKFLSETLHELISHGDLEGVQEWRAYLRELRQSSLSKHGIFSYGNNVFKFLRKWGDLGKAADFVLRYL